MAQRLVRRLCDGCKEETEIPDYLKTGLGFEKGTKAFQPKGCKRCGNSGYKGRVALCEFLELTEEIKNMIAKSASESELKEAARKAGMRTLREEGAIKLKRGLTSLEEVLRVTAED